MDPLNHPSISQEPAVLPRRQLIDNLKSDPQVMDFLLRSPVMEFGESLNALPASTWDIPDEQITKVHELLKGIRQ